MPGAIAAALGVRGQAGRSELEALADYLQGKQLLLVLDNCEHLIAACAQAAEVLLRAAAPAQAPGQQPGAAGRAGRAVLPGALAGAAGRRIWGMARCSPPCGTARPAGSSSSGRCPPSRASPWKRRIVPRWRRLFSGSTASRSQSSWRPRGCGCCRPSRSPRALTTVSGCLPVAAAPLCPATRRCWLPSSGAISCSRNLNGRCCAGCRCSPEAGCWRPPSKWLPTKTRPRMWPPWA